MRRYDSALHTERGTAIEFGVELERDRLVEVCADAGQRQRDGRDGELRGRLYRLVLEAQRRIIERECGEGEGPGRRCWLRRCFLWRRCLWCCRLWRVWLGYGGLRRPLGQQIHQAQMSVKRAQQGYIDAAQGKAAGRELARGIVERDILERRMGQADRLPCVAGRRNLQALKRGLRDLRA